MTLPLSIYLNILRLLAALAVYAFHTAFFSGARIPFFGDFGTQAVIVFFVLSGLVIAFSASTKHTGVVDFFIARLARLWSVAIPAIILTFAVDSIGQYLSLESYSPMQPYSPFKWFAASIVNGFFINQIWNLNIWLGTNGPFWSLSYEFWYYAIFSTVFFLKGSQRIIFTLLACLIAGPKILVAAPIWALGVLLYRRMDGNLAPKMGLLIWLGSFVIGLLFTFADVPAFLTSHFAATYERSTREWAVSFWPYSYLIGLIVAMNIYGYYLMGDMLKISRLGIERQIRKIADTSFGIYLFHYPLIYFFKAILKMIGFSKGWVYVFGIYGLTLLASVALAFWCERYKKTISTRLTKFSDNWGFAKLGAVKGEPV